MPLPLGSTTVLLEQCRFAEAPLASPRGRSPLSGGKCPAGTKGVGTAGCGAKRSRLMRVGEQLRFDEHAKLSISAPWPSSVACGDSFPQGKLWGAFRAAVRAKATAADQREGQALSYKDVPTMKRSPESLLLSGLLPGWGGGGVLWHRRTRRRESAAVCRSGKARRSQTVPGTRLRPFCRHGFRSRRRCHAPAGRSRPFAYGRSAFLLWKALRLSAASVPAARGGMRGKNLLCAARTKN